MTVRWGASDEWRLARSYDNRPAPLVLRSRRWYEQVNWTVVYLYLAFMGVAHIFARLTYMSAVQETCLVFMAVLAVLARVRGQASR